METIEKQKKIILNKEEELLRYEKDIKTKGELIDALNKKVRLEELQYLLENREIAWKI